MAQVLILEDIMSKLLENGGRTAAGEQLDPEPVLKLFMPDSGWTWLLTEIDPSNHDLAFGLTCNGYDDPKYGYVSISELRSVRSRLGLSRSPKVLQQLSEPEVSGCYAGLAMRLLRRQHQNPMSCIGGQSIDGRGLPVG
jgi:hypothetical protein